MADVKIVEKKIEQEAEQLYERYRDQMDLYEKSIVAKIKGGLHPYDVYALGKQLEAFDIYRAICEEDGNLNQLGKIPTIAYDVITVAYGTSVIPVIASVQPIDEEQGAVYFKNVKAGTTKGSITAGTTFASATSAGTTPTGYASNYVEGEVVGTGDGATTTFSATLAQKPVRSQTVKITLEGSTTVFGQDDGKGNIIGAGVSGTINYTTGEISLTFTTAPESGKKIYASYQSNLELAEDIPSIQTYWDSTTVMARVYALKGSIGLLQSYGMRRRFGLVAEDELARDLVSEINAEIGGDIIRKLAASAPGSVEWSKTPPSGISYYEHKQTFKDALADVESVLVGQAGRGVISVLIAGRNVAAIVSTLPGFTKLTDGSTIGAHIYGTLDGMTVVRVVDASVLDPNKAVAIYKGANPFEAAAVYAPYMPLTVTTTLPAGKNPLGNQRAAAVWAGVEVLVKNFAVTLNVTTS